MDLGRRHQRKDRQIAVVVQQQVQLDRAFGLPEVGPREQVQTQIDRGGVQAKQLVFETEPLLLARGLGAAAIQQLKEQPPPQFTGAMLIGIGQGALGRRGGHTQMVQFAARTG